MKLNLLLCVFTFCYAFSDAFHTPSDNLNTLRRDVHTSRQIILKSVIDYGYYKCMVHFNSNVKVYVHADKVLGDVEGSTYAALKELRAELNEEKSKGKNEAALNECLETGEDKLEELVLDKRDELDVVESNLAEEVDVYVQKLEVYRQVGLKLLDELVDVYPKCSKTPNVEACMTSVLVNSPGAEVQHYIIQSEKLKHEVDIAVAALSAKANRLIDKVVKNVPNEVRSLKMEVSKCMKNA